MLKIEHSELDTLGNIIEITDSLKVPDFNLYNQDGVQISNSDLLGNNYIVNFSLPIAQQFGVNDNTQLD